ncbi:MAG: hypothetical protein ACETWG_05710 [Candidatus Neomarinimicrobiota bacterium]
MDWLRRNRKSGKLENSQGVSTMRYLIILLLMTGLYAQDTLITTTGIGHLGEYIKTTEKHILFRPEDTSDIKPVPKQVVDRVILSDGTIIYSSEGGKDIMPILKMEPSTTDEQVPSVEESLAKIAKSNQTIATVLTIFLGISIASIILSILIATS